MLSEERTRKTLIDTALRLAGWPLDDPTQVVEEYVIDLVEAGVVAPIAAEPGFGNHHGKQLADYALLTRGRVVAVVEAKKTAKAAELGQEQALTYARNIPPTATTSPCGRSTTTRPPRSAASRRRWTWSGWTSGARPATRCPSS